MSLSFAKIPEYSADLLVAAKRAVAICHNGRPSDISTAIANLEDSILEFERRMPVAGGVVQSA